jgi:hypothetical protein
MTRVTAVTEMGDPDTSRMRTPRCKHTLLTKPECHCPACLFEQIDTHRGGARPGQAAGPTTQRLRRSA